MRKLRKKCLYRNAKRVEGFEATIRMARLADALARMEKLAQLGLTGAFWIRVCAPGAPAPVSRLPWSTLMWRIRRIRS